MTGSSSAQQFLLFLIAGGFAAAANISSRMLLGHWLPYITSIVVAYCLGMMTAFALNKWFVFGQADNRLRHQVLWFIAINLAAIVQTLVVSLLLAHWPLPALGVHFHNESITHAVGVLVPVVTSYVGHKRLSFATDASRTTTGIAAHDDPTLEPWHGSRFPNAQRATGIVHGHPVCGGVQVQ